MFGFEGGEDQAQQEAQPFEEAPEDGVGGAALGSGEMVAVHAVVGFGVSDDRFDRRAAAQFAFDRFGDPASLAGDRP